MNLAASPPARSRDDDVESSATIHYIGTSDTEATVRLVRRTPRQRASRAALGLASCWGLAVGAVFIPLLHFVLVPALLLAGPFVARSRWLEHATVLGARGTCPGCGKPLDVSLRQPARAELPFRCSECGRPLALRLDATALEGAPAL